MSKKQKKKQDKPRLNSILMRKFKDHKMQIRGLASLCDGYDKKCDELIDELCIEKKKVVELNIRLADIQKERPKWKLSDFIYGAIWGAVGMAIFTKLYFTLNP